MTIIPTTTGEIPFTIPGTSTTSSTWYKIIGDVTQHPPLIVLHGGPGAGHEYLSPLTNLYVDHKIPLIFYDQIGCGRSTHFRDKLGDQEFWSFDLFLSELDNLIDHLKLRENGGFYLLGQSWGGVLCGIYASRRPKGLLKAVISSGPASIPLYIEGTKRLLAELPEEVRKVLEEADRTGDYESKEYEKAAAVFYGRHVCRLDEPWPEDLQAAFGHLNEDKTTYLTVQGPSEFVITGSIKNWAGWEDAHKVQVDTLLLNGRYDEVQDLCVEPWFTHIPKIKWVTLEGSSHMAHWEERDRYMEVVGGFLVDGSTSG